MVLRIIVFAVLSAGIAWFSRSSLRVPQSHGFYRFFAWECILALFVLNFRSFGQWFGNPLSLRQLVSWFLLFGCLVPLALGTHLLYRRGRPDTQQRADESLIGIEKTTRLVTSGIYRYIRHPLYSSLLLLAWGVFFKSLSWVGGGLAAGATIFLIVTAKVEETEDLRYFGDPYRIYKQRTKMFIPFLF